MHSDDNSASRQGRHRRVNNIAFNNNSNKRKNINRTFKDKIKDILLSDKSAIQFLMIAVILLTSVALSLSFMVAYLLVYGTDNNNNIFNNNNNNNNKVFDNYAILDLWRLYDAATKSGDVYHKKAFHTYMLKYKEMIIAKMNNETLLLNEGNNNNNKFKRRSVDSGVIGLDLKNAKISNFTIETSNKKNITEVIEAIQQILNNISLQDPKNGIKRAANFVEEEFNNYNNNNNPLLNNASSIIYNEKESFEPFDDILYLQLRQFFYNTEDISINTRNWWRNIKNTIPSVYNKRFYYPLRRYHKIYSFSDETYENSKIWFHTIAHDYLGDDVEEFTPYELPKEYSNYILEAESNMFNNNNNNNNNKASSQKLLEIKSLAQTATLFVSIASFRDRECWPTIENMIERSSNIFRIYFGIAEQNRAQDNSCIDNIINIPQYCISLPKNNNNNNNNNKENNNNNYNNKTLCFHQDNIRIRHIRASAAYGPTYGRYMAMLLFHGEDFTLVLDSHNRFIFAWDTKIIFMHLQMQHPKLVLSHYPESYSEEMYNKINNNNNNKRTTSAYLCRAKFLDDAGYLRLTGILIHNPQKFQSNYKYLLPYIIPELHNNNNNNNSNSNSNNPLLQPWAAGGFLFSNSTMIREVPFDPHLPHIFDGEEIMFSIRLFTHGFDIYSPIESICFHFYGRRNNPKVWREAQRWGIIQKQSRQRIQYFLQSRIRGVNMLRIPKESATPVVVVDADRFGIGSLRSVEDWYTFAGVDPIHYTVDGRWCG